MDLTKWEWDNERNDGMKERYETEGRRMPGREGRL
jgi:hypothetical protein